MDTEALKQSLVAKFVEVSEDRLEKIQLGVLELEKPEATTALAEVARELHTMKGEARMLGLNAIGELVHATEDLLKARGAVGPSPRSATDLFLRACDALSELLQDQAAAVSGSDASRALMSRLRELSAEAAKASPQPTAPAPSPDPAPPERALRAGDDGAGERQRAERSIRVNVELLDGLGLLAGDLLVESARARLRMSELWELLERYERLNNRWAKLADAMGVREVHTLESDAQLLRDDAFRFMRRHTDGVNALGGEMQKLASLVGEARLVPFASVFEGLPRQARDLARAHGKDVELVVENSGVGVDRAMVGDIRDALVHLLRNAIDHGLEPAAERATLGKRPAGRVAIRARAEGDMIHLDVEDDGRGIDVERLKQTAIGKGLLTPRRAAGLSSREALELVFVSGLSTRDAVTELSGRGVGMDVVRRKVDTMGGSVALSSRAGLGTTFRLRLPQSMVLMRVLLLRLGEDVYGIPAADVEAVGRVQPEERLEAFGAVAIRFGGQPLALVALGPLLGLNGGPRNDRPPLIVVRHGLDRVALVVDGFVGEREVAVKQCGGEFLTGARFTAGTASLEDGSVAVLLHVPDVMAEIRSLGSPEERREGSKKLRVLLVDDSPIARATAGALVRALGHALEEAHDGEQAFLRALQQPFDLVLTDVQMPRLDGFGLTRRLKSHPRLQRVPVIVLSSLAAPEDRRRGVDAGADAYLVKGELRLELLAQTIDRLTS